MPAELTGHRLGVYELRDRVGVGGMGEVYRARDTHLGRDVAVKILPPAFAAERDRRERLEREARVLASLNHPNIATIHGLEVAGGVHGLVMELVEGETLGIRVARGPLPQSEVLTIARQIADALDAAHERGIIHCDLKPANVMLTSSGLVKVLDFGLAKAAARDDAASDASNAATMTAFPMREDVIIGTPAYMSPEQVRGGVVDKRTDIWAFGCVLYEMIAGRPAFARRTTSDTFAAILEPDVDCESLAPTVSSPLRQLVKDCLATDPHKRLRDIADARLRIDEITSTPPAAAPATVSARMRSWPWAVATLGVAVLAGAALSMFFTAGESPVASPARFTLSFGGQSPDVAVGTVPSPSPDGRQLVFVGTDEQGVTSLRLRAIEAAESTPIAGTEGAQTPVWSPDGAWIGFYADGRLKKVPVGGGPPQTIASLPGFQEASWGSADVIIFRAGNRQGLSRVSATGGEPAPLTHLNTAGGENSHRGPTFLPDGRTFLFTSRCADSADNALYLGSLDSPAVRRLMSAQSKVLYLHAGGGDTGSLLYYRDGGLESRPFDVGRSALGDSKVVFANVDYNSASIAAFFEASADGRVIIVRQEGTGGAQLTWFERDGEQTGTLGSPGDQWQPRLSPKGDRVAIVRPDPRNGNRDIWLIDIARGIAAPLTRNAANDWHPVWSADGTQLLFNSDRSGRAEGVLFLKRALDAGGEETQLLDVPGFPTDWSRDGRWVALNGLVDPGGQDVVSIVSPQRTTKRLLDTLARHGAARFSPNGEWVAYTSDETGQFEVFVRAFADGEAGPEAIQISEAGGDYALWRPDGQELFFMSEDATIHAVATGELRPGGAVSRQQALFRACPESFPRLTPLSGRFYGRAFDTRDGERFLVNCALPSSREFVVLLNWPLAAHR